MMNKYLEKIAKTVSKDEPKKKFGVARGVLAGYGTAVVGQFGLMAAQGPIKKTIDQKSNLDKGTFRKILKDNKDLDVTFSPNKAFKKTKAGNSVRHEFTGHGPAYANKDVINEFAKKHPSTAMHGPSEREVMKKNYVHMGSKATEFRPDLKRSKNLHVAMHELGHARDYHNLGRTAIGRHIIKAEKFGRTMGGHSAGSLVGGAMLSNEKTRDYAWAAPIATNAVTLRSEGAANYHGYKMLGKHGTSAMKKGFLGVAAKNMIGYGAGSAVAAGVLHHLNKSIKKKEHQE